MEQQRNQNASPSPLHQTTQHTPLTPLGPTDAQECPLKTEDAPLTPPPLLPRAMHPPPHQTWSLATRNPLSPAVVGAKKQTQTRERTEEKPTSSGGARQKPKPGASSSHTTSQSNSRRKPGVGSSEGHSTSGGAGAGSRSKAGAGVSSRLVPCPLCGRNYAKSVIEVHAASCEGGYQSGSVAAPVSCPLCSRSFPPDRIEAHAANCGEAGVCV